MKRYIRVLLDSIVVLFILFILNAVLDIEFYEYPHAQVVSIDGSVETAFGKHIISPIWTESEGSEINNLTQIQIEFAGETGHFQWWDPGNSRIAFGSGYQMTLIRWNSLSKDTTIEIIDRNKAFLLIRGRRIIL